MKISESGIRNLSETLPGIPFATAPGKSPPNGRFGQAASPFAVASSADFGETTTDRFDQPASDNFARLICPAYVVLPLIFRVAYRRKPPESSIMGFLAK